MGRSGTALFVAVFLSASAPASAGTERPCPSCGHDTARVAGATAGAADYLCRFCEVVLHVRPDGREAVSYRMAGARREFDLVGGARLHFPLPGSYEEAVVPVGEAALAAARGAGHPVRLPGHPVNLPGHPVPLPAAPVGLPSHPVGLPGHPVDLPEHPVGLPDHPVNLPGHTVSLPSHAVRLPGHAVNLPGHPVRLPGHPVRLPGHPMGMSGTIILATRVEPVETAPVVVAAPQAAPKVVAAPAPAADPAPEPRPERAKFFGRRAAESEGTVPACPPSSSARTSSSFFSRR